MSLTNWLRSGAYLPAPLRDFHDQKEVFKTLWQRVEKRKSKDPSTASYLGSMGWVEAQVLVIDHFLWFMAAHGWTLQRSRARIADPYEDLDGAIHLRREAEVALLKTLMAAPMPSNSVDQDTKGQGK